MYYHSMFILLWKGKQNKTRNTYNDLMLIHTHNSVGPNRGFTLLPSTLTNLNFHCIRLVFIFMALISLSTMNDS